MDGETGYTTSRLREAHPGLATHNGNQIASLYRQWLKILDQHSKKMGTKKKMEEEIPPPPHARFAGWKSFRRCSVDSRSATSQMAAYNCNSWNMYRKTFGTEL